MTHFVGILLSSIRCTSSIYFSHNRFIAIDVTDLVDSKPNWVTLKYFYLHSISMFLRFLCKIIIKTKVALSCLRHFLATERNDEKWWKVLFCSTLRSVFVLKIFRFWSWLFGHVEKRLDFWRKIFLFILSLLLYCHYLVVFTSLVIG